MPKITPQPWRKLVAVFEADGFAESRIRGDHYIMRKPGVMRPVVIPMLKDVPELIILNNLRTARMTRERYFELLARA